MFPPSGHGTLVPSGKGDRGADDVAFVTLAMPIMFGPGAIATLRSLAS
jgi:small neutral amino acid transporter SnatA (MarC family)